MSQPGPDDALAAAYLQAVGAATPGGYAIRKQELAWLLEVSSQANRLRLALLASLQKAAPAAPKGPGAGATEELKSMLTNLIIMQTRLNEREQALAGLLERAALPDHVAADAPAVAALAALLAAAARRLREATRPPP